jgi:hypothetical protein
MTAFYPERSQGRHSRLDGPPALLAYSYEDDSAALTLLALGVHENFYRDLKG